MVCLGVHLGASRGNHKRSGSMHGFTAPAILVLEGDRLSSLGIYWNWCCAAYKRTYIKREARTFVRSGIEPQ